MRCSARIKGRIRAYGEGTRVEEEDKENAQRGDQKRLGEGAVKKGAEKKRGAENRTHAPATRSSSRDGGMLRRVPGKVERRRENREEEEDRGDEEKKMIGERCAEGDELDEKQRDAEKDEEDGFEHLEAIEGEG